MISLLEDERIYHRLEKLISPEPTTSTFFCPPMDISPDSTSQHGRRSPKATHPLPLWLDSRPYRSSHPTVQFIRFHVNTYGNILRARFVTVKRALEVAKTRGDVWYPYGLAHPLPRSQLWTSDRRGE